MTNLYHKALDKPVKLGAVIVPLVAQQQEVVHGLRYDISAQLEVKHAEGGDQPYVTENGELQGRTSSANNKQKRCGQWSGFELRGQNAHAFFPDFFTRLYM